MAPKAENTHSTVASLASPTGLLPLDGYSRWPDVRRLIPLSRESVRLRELAGRFPKRVQLGSERCVAWPNRELHRYLADPNGYKAEA